MKTIEELKKEAQDAALAARKADEALQTARDKENEARREPLKKLVERAHNCFCQWNHTDGCGWHYENDWNGWTHDRWLKKYDELINGSYSEKGQITLDQLDKFVTVAENIKKDLGVGMRLFRNGRLTP